MIFADAKLADFPERLDPMTVKELRQGLRARNFVIPFVCIHLAMLGASGIDYLITDRIISDPFWNGISEGGWLFWAIAAFMLWFVMPATRFFDIQTEYRGRNAELLLLSNVSRWKIVKGKWLMSCSLSLLTFVSVLPYLLLRYFYGGFELVENFVMGAGLLLNSAAITAMVIGASAYRSYLGRVALILAALVVLGITLIGPTIGAVNRLASTQPWIGYCLFASVCAAAVFFTVLGLQLARVKLRTFEDPYDPAPGSQVIILYLFAPLLIGIPGLFTFFIGGAGAIGAALFFTWIALNIDPPPKKGKRAYYAQP